jgi:hypothetical protein
LNYPMPLSRAWFTSRRWQTIFIYSNPLDGNSLVDERENDSASATRSASSLCASMFSNGKSISRSLRTNAKNASGAVSGRESELARPHHGSLIILPSSPIVKDCLRRSLAHFNLGAHLLDLPCLLLQARSKRLNFLLLQCGSRLEVFSLLRDGRLKLLLLP